MQFHSMGVEPIMINSPSFFQKSYQNIHQWMNYTIKTLQSFTEQMKNNPSLRVVVATNMLFFTILYPCSNYLNRLLENVSSSSFTKKIFRHLCINGIVGASSYALNVQLSKISNIPLTQSHLLAISATYVVLRMILNKIFKKEQVSSSSNFSNSQSDKAKYSPLKEKNLENQRKLKGKAIKTKESTDNFQDAINQAERVMQQKLKKAEEDKKKNLERIEEKKKKANELHKTEMDKIKKEHQAKVDAFDQSKEKLKQESLKRSKSIPASPPLGSLLMEKNANIFDSTTFFQLGIYEHQGKVSARITSHSFGISMTSIVAEDKIHWLSPKSDLKNCDDWNLAGIEVIYCQPNSPFLVMTKELSASSSMIVMLEIYENQGKVSALIKTFIIGNVLLRLVKEDEINWNSPKSDLKNPDCWTMDGNNKIIYCEPNPKAKKAKELGIKHASQGIDLLKKIGLNTQTDESQIKNGIKKFLLKNHPDKNPNCDQELVKEVMQLLEMLNQGVYSHYKTALGK